MIFDDTGDGGRGSITLHAVRARTTIVHYLSRVLTRVIVYTADNAVIAE